MILNTVSNAGSVVVDGASRITHYHGAPTRHTIGTAIAATRHYCPRLTLQLYCRFNQRLCLCT
jgi:hypothetical protein